MSCHMVADLQDIILWVGFNFIGRFQGCLQVLCDFWVGIACYMSAKLGWVSYLLHLNLK